MASMKTHFLLDPSVTFLNFGSFGACVRPVFENYQRWQLELEREPVQFIAVNGPGYLKTSREALGSFIQCSPEDVVYVTNPSYGVNIIAKSLALEPGDEVLSTDLEYGACDRAWSYYCEKKGAQYIKQPISLPVISKEKFIEDFVKGISSRTKAIFISHITSATALILPVADICRIAREKGIMTFIDGAHAPGQLPLDLSALDVDIYTGACHKWMMTPKSCSFLYVKKNLQPLFDPLLISWGYNSATPSSSQFLDYHELQGTRDFSAFLTVPEAIRFMNEHDWPQVAKQCREMVLNNAGKFCALFGTQPLAPLTEEFIAQMFSIPINTTQPENLQRHLFQRYKIEIPVMKHNGNTYLRYSINAFNKQEDLDNLYNALKEIMHDTDFFSNNATI